MLVKQDTNCLFGENLGTYIYFVGMNLQREGSFLAHPLVLDGTSYAFQKQRKIYLTAIDKRVWQCILTRCYPPTKTYEDGVESPNPVKEWSNDELDASRYMQEDLMLLSMEFLFQH